MDTQKPSVGRIVHYIDASSGTHRAAIILSVNDNGTVDLEIFGGFNGNDIRNSIRHVEPEEVSHLVGDEKISTTYGTYHWPERV